MNMNGWSILWRAAGICFCCSSSAQFATTTSTVESLPPNATSQNTAATAPKQQQPVTLESLRNTTDVIRLQLTRQHFDRICEFTELNAEQLEFARSAFSTYEQRLLRLKNKILDQTGSSVMAVVGPQSRKEAIPPDVLSTSIETVSRALTRSNAETRQALDDFLMCLDPLLTEAQKNAMAAAMRSWRREVMLNVSVGGASGRDLVYQVDLLAVVKETCQEVPELRPLLDGMVSPTDDLHLVKVRAECMALLEQHELQFDWVLQEQFWRTLVRNDQAMMARANGEIAKVDQFRQSYLRDWFNVYNQSTQAAEKMASLIAEGLGPKWGEVWIDRYFAAYYPTLYRPKSTELLNKWLRARTDLDQSQISALDTVYAQYLQSRTLLRLECRTLRLRLLTELNFTPGWLAFMELTGKAPEKLTQSKERRQSLAEQNTQQMRSVLSPSQQIEFDATLAKFRQHTSADGFELEF